MWRPPVKPSPAEQAVIKAVRRAKLFVFLRQHRHELFDEQFQAELAETYADSPKGQPPVPPARLALATILQAYAKVSDDEVIEATVMDRRWQLVLDCMGAEEPPFSKGTLVWGSASGSIGQDLDRRADRADGGAGGADEEGSGRGRCGGAGLLPAVGGGPGGGDRGLTDTTSCARPWAISRPRRGGGGRGTAVVAGSWPGAAAGRLQPEGGAGCGLG